MNFTRKIPKTCYITVFQNIKKKDDIVIGVAKISFMNYYSKKSKKYSIQIKKGEE